jgi:uncharacterized protein
MHHYRTIDYDRAKQSIIRLDDWIDTELAK